MINLDPRPNRDGAQSVYFRVQIRHHRTHHRVQVFARWGYAYADPTRDNGVRFEYAPDRNWINRHKPQSRPCHLHTAEEGNTDN